MPDYNLSEAFAVIEDYLIDSMRRNMLRHIAEEKREHFSWAQWQAEMLSGLREYKRSNAKHFQSFYPAIEEKIDRAMWEAYDTGEALQEQVILSAIKQGYTAYRPKNTQNAEFFRMNKRKMNALVSETQKSMKTATAAALRMANDQYRSIIFGAQVFYNSGAGTLWQAVDMASKKFLQTGLNCVEYRDGRRVNIASYAEMALRTANTRAYLHGEAAMREKYGIHTVIVNRHNAACPLCVPFQGRVFIDDVWGGGTAAEAQVKGYPLLSEAMAAGLYHPNCKDGHTTFFVGINVWHPPTPGMQEEQVRDAKISLADAKKLRQSAEVAKAEARAAQRRYTALMRMENVGRIKVSVETPDPVSVKVHPVSDTVLLHTQKIRVKVKVPQQAERIERIFEQGWIKKVKDEKQIDDIITMFQKMDDKKLRFFERYGTMIRGDFYSDKRPHTVKGVIEMNLSAPDERSFVLGYTNINIYALMHESGHAMDAALGIRGNIGDLRRTLEEDFYHYASGMVGRRVRKLENLTDDECGMISDSLRGYRIGGISDIMEGLTEGELKLPYGHHDDPDYWVTHSVSTEAIAHLFEAYMNGGQKYQEFIRYFPKTMRYFEDYLNQIM